MKEGEQNQGSFIKAGWLLSNPSVCRIRLRQDCEGKDLWSRQRNHIKRFDTKYMFPAYEDVAFQNSPYFYGLVINLLFNLTVL